MNGRPTVTITVNDEALYTLLAIAAVRYDALRASDQPGDQEWADEVGAACKNVQDAIQVALRGSRAA